MLLNLMVLISCIINKLSNVNKPSSVYVIKIVIIINTIITTDSIILTCVHVRHYHEKYYLSTVVFHQYNFINFITAKITIIIINIIIIYNIIIIFVNNVINMFMMILLLLCHTIIDMHIIVIINIIFPTTVIIITNVNVTINISMAREIILLLCFLITITLINVKHRNINAILNQSSYSYLSSSSFLSQTTS